MVATAAALAAAADGGGGCTVADLFGGGGEEKSENEREKERESASENDEGRGREREDERHSVRKREEEREIESADGRVVRTTDCIRLVFNFFPTFCFTCVLCASHSLTASLCLSLSFPSCSSTLSSSSFSLPQSVLDE